MWNLKRLNSLGLCLDTGYGRAYSKWSKNKHCRTLSVAAKLAAVVHKSGDTCAVTSRVLSEMVGQGMLFRSRVTSAAASAYNNVCSSSHNAASCNPQYELYAALDWLHSNEQRVMATSVPVKLTDRDSGRD